MSEKPLKIVALILAAGESRRLGKPKQLLSYNNTTLLNHVKKQFPADLVEGPFVVLGAFAKEVRLKSALNNTEVIEFDGWKEGMGSSLAYACKQLFSKSDYDGILITLGDLPKVSQSDYRNMIALFHAPGDIVATQVNDSIGVPALFGSDYFLELMQICGERGAKSLLMRYKERITVYANPNAGFDIDTYSDYSNLNSNE
ncbi:nucleotidyltransferase family protein [uncultured Draconibacterium sp.]|uniref:nucleotidyltransferase family protein n=1 Tax=uncultured Draconibacterium sp. TaxID=1573823 RepID=UPI0032172203